MENQKENKNLNKIRHFKSSIEDFLEYWKSKEKESKNNFSKSFKSFNQFIGNKTNR